MIFASISIPIGEWASQTLAWVEPLVVTTVAAVAAYAMRTFPSWAVSLASEYLTQKRIERAVHWGVTQIDHEMIDPATGQYRTVSLETGNALAEMAEQYMLTFAPDIASQLGARLKPRILAEVAKIGMAPAAPIPNPLPPKPLPQITR